MYVPETNFVRPQSFLEALENFYIVFMDTLQQMQYNTTCTRVGIYLSAPRENASDEVRTILQGAMNAGYAGLGSYIEKNVSGGNVTAG